MLRKWPTAVAWFTILVLGVHFPTSEFVLRSWCHDVSFWCCTEDCGVLVSSRQSHTLNLWKRSTDERCADDGQQKLIMNCPNADLVTMVTDLD